MSIVWGSISTAYVWPKRIALYRAISPKWIIYPMSNIKQGTTEGFELHGVESFLHFGSDQMATFHRESPDYWNHTSEHQALTDGRILSVFEYDTTWSHWERHPLGDEFAVRVARRGRPLVRSTEPYRDDSAA